jgi:HTH-type transcriptional regulator / antitoxin HipB
MEKRFEVEFLPDAVEKLNSMPTKKLKTVSLETMIDNHIGKEGTSRRDTFEQELRLDLLGYAIKEARLYHNLTQEQFGKLIGVQKAQISKLENNFTDARFDTVIKAFNALNVKVNFRVELPKRKLSLG